MSNLHECAVCCEDKIPVTKILSCPGCTFEACSTCQKRVLTHNCMNCGGTFTNKSLTEKLGKTFVNGPLRKHDETSFHEREKGLLPETQPLVEWERIRRREMAKVRFRQTPQIPPRPVIAEKDGKTVDALYIVFPCPKTACRGFVVRGKCGVCADAICIHCREPANPASHTCDPNVLESIKAINTECRACPQCATMIYRIMGCNHMHCQACKSHFDWVTGKLLANSTNHHYAGAANYSNNIITRNLEANTSCEDDTPHQIMHDHIPKDIMVNVINENSNTELYAMLYDDPNVIRTTKNSKFNEREIIASWNNSLVVCRVQFMMEELTEAKWKSRIYTLEKQKDRDLLFAELFNIYLSTIRDFQSYVYNNPSTESIDRVKVQVVEFIKMTNDSFLSLQEEHGGPVIKLRTDFSNPNLPAVIM